jgi:ATP-dependent RNA helicase DDX54/DBP10
MSAAAVILSPTRELSLQTLKVLKTLSSCISSPPMNCIGINGGESMEKQFSLLSSRPDVIVATPGRLAHHLSEIPDFHLNHCDLVIFDEADRLFEMGFSLQIRQICSSMPGADSGRQTLLFSATMPKVLVEFTRSGIMNSEPSVVRLDKDATVSEELRVGFVCVRSQDRDAALIHLLRDVLPKANCIGEDSHDNNSNHDNNTTQDEMEMQQLEDDKKQLERNEKKNQNKLQFKGGILNAEDSRMNQPKSKLGLTLIFAATKHHVDYLTVLINNSGITGRGNRKEGFSDIATCIYGSMDQEARRQNLYSFRSGKKPIMVVTDIAARGIDVPLIDHVIHYSFPTNPKLFVHRSGRAARAGRIGYCWGLVDAEEMGYMVDLYLFLGRKLGTGHEKYDKFISNSSTTEQDSNEKRRDEVSQDDKIMYSIEDMTPEMVHFGGVPESTLTEEVENVLRIKNSELTSSHDSEALRKLLEVCANAMKQYRRTRPDASKQGMRRAKAILEGKKEASGKRVGGGMIPSHPVLRKAEVDRIMASYSNSNKSGEKRKEEVKQKLDELKQREDFLRAMSNFRPKETIFESFATGGGKTIGVVSHLDKGCTTNGANKKNSSAAFDAMKSMRRQMKLAHDKGVSLVVAGSDAALTINGEPNTVLHDECDGHDVEKSTVAELSTVGANKEVKITDKRRLSKAERKRMKKKGCTVKQLERPNVSAKAPKQREDYRDHAFYIDNEEIQNSEEAQRGRQIEAAMQPSASNANDGVAAAQRLEQAMLDIVGDENADMVKNHRIMRWDKSKRKYIQTTIGSEVSGDSKSKKLRLESGQFIKSDKAKLGELYEKWQKKTNQSIGRVGVFDDVTADDTAENEFNDNRAGKNRKQKGKVATNDLKTASEVRKKREAEKKMQLKNMKKSDRSKLETRKRADRNAKVEEAKSQGRGWQGKKGYSGRHGSQGKGKFVKKR